MARDFAAHEYELLGRLVDAGWTSPCVYDVGSSNTSWSSMMRRRLPGAAFHLFDPLARDYGGTFANFDMSLRWAVPPAIAVDLKPIAEYISHAVALGDRNGECEMLTDQYGFGSTTLPTAPGKPEWWKKRVAVPMRRLDDLVEETGIPAPTLMKIDTQGSELAILRGAERTVESCELLLLETWLYRDYGPQTPVLGELIEWLTPRGFVLFDLGHRFWDRDTHRLYSVDAYFAKPAFLAAYGHAARGVPAPVAKAV